MKILSPFTQPHVVPNLVACFCRTQKEVVWRMLIAKELVCFFSDSWSRCLDLSLFYFSQHALALSEHTAADRDRALLKAELADSLTAFFFGIITWVDLELHKLSQTLLRGMPSPPNFLMPLRKNSYKTVWKNSVIICSPSCYFKPSIFMEDENRCFTRAKTFKSTATHCKTRMYISRRKCEMVLAVAKNTTRLLGCSGWLLGCC